MWATWEYLGDRAMERRSFLSWLITGTGLIIAGITGLPALVMLLSSTFRTRGPTWRPLGSLSEFEQGEVRRATVPIPQESWAARLDEKAVYVWRSGESEVVVFSRNCTDLSCPVRWDPGSERFFCPCHGGIFAKDGTNLEGPPPRPLWRYETRITNGVIEIDLASLPPIT